MNIANTKGMLIAALIAFGLLAVSVALAACGDDDESAGGGATTTAAGNGVDRAFVEEMIPHHESAVDMAEIATERGQSDFVRSLADDIIRTQNAEISTMRTIASELDSAGVEPQAGAMGEHGGGMDTDVSSLRTADPFEQAFIDMMVPHHQSAIEMARVVLDQGESAEVKQLAEQIIAAQAREIRAMNEHRTEEFGAPSPAGGVPAEDGAEPEADSGGPSDDSAAEGEEGH